MKKNIFLFLSLSFVNAQEIPNEFFQFQYEKILLDAGKNWENNTTFGPVRFNHQKGLSDSLTVRTRFGFYLSKNKTALYGYGFFTFKQHFHGYLYPRIVNDPESFGRFTGVPRDIERAGFKSGETDLSGISYENNWMILQFGRGRQSWGAGNDIQLAIGDKSPAYDYGMLDLDFGKLKVRYFHGYLETDTLNFNRYITGRGFEWRNQKSLILGLSEIVIYSGENRPIDFSYFNPMSTHLEIELNERQNQEGTGSGNGVWQISADYLSRSNFRISMNYLFDEFTLDNEQTNEGKANARAYSLKVVYTPIKMDKAILSFYITSMAVGTFTFKHQSGYNNFVQRNKPLGWPIGSDSKEIKLGLNSIYKKIIIANFELGQRLIGEGNFKESPYRGYTHYLDGPFPSGDFKTVHFLTGTIQWWWKHNISFIAAGEYYDINANNSEIKLKIGIDIFYPYKKTI